MQTAELLGIHRTTLRNWKLTHDEIRRLYQSDGQDGDEERKKQVEEALLKRAIGYTQTEITRQVGKDGKLGVVKTVEKQGDAKHNGADLLAEEQMRLRVGRRRG